MVNQLVLNVKVAIEAILPVSAFAATERSVNDVYKHVLIKFNGNQCFAIGCNGSQSIIRTVQLQGMLVEPFELCLDGVKLRAVLSGLKDVSSQEMTIVWDDVSAVIKVGRSKLNIPVINASAFPYPDKLNDENFCAVLPSTVFIESLKFTSHSCAERDVRYFLNGCHVKFSDGIFCAIGSDGHRISRVVKSISLDSKASGAVHQGIIPKKFLDMLFNNIGKCGDVRIRMNTDMIEITWSEGQLRSTLIDGKYPDSTAFFSGENTPFFQCSRAELVQSLSRLKATAYEKLPSLSIALCEDGEVKLSTLDEQKNESGIDFLSARIDPAAQSATEFCVNLFYLSECLSQMNQDDIEFSLCAGNSIKIKQSTDDSVNTVIGQLRR